MSNAVSTARKPVARAARSKGDPGHSGQRNAALAWLTLPALFFFLVFAVVPLAGVLILSFASWDGIGSIGSAALGNWFSVLADPGLRMLLRPRD